MTILCIMPISPCSVIAKRSLLCTFHQADDLSAILSSPALNQKKEGAGVTLQDRGAKGKLVLTSGIFAGIAVPKFRVKPSGSSCALADRPRRLRRLFKLNKSFLMIPVDERMQRVKTRSEQRK